ncbi:hypothetical protein AJ80_05614 [Polytolypa hystricis UAMH7299]|uniref:Uncharacterized protein n=1 Tax=Polytolypa hystricis (strain UAMH7299) TaxID=1447883 RepID=A0A2B7Y2I3_POLH7|nr:hypothetical protein AJ80_05614 [Polytolypa hystricis UAMH7299]
MYHRRLHEGCQKFQASIASTYSGCPADDLVSQHLDSFSEAHHEFMEIFEEEEKSIPPMNGVASYRTNIMRMGWEIGIFWHFQALDSLKELYNIFRDHIQPIFAPSHNMNSISHGLYRSIGLQM